MHFCVTPRLHYAQCIALGILTKKQLKITCPISQFNSYVSGRHCSYQVLINNNDSSKRLTSLQVYQKKMESAKTLGNNDCNCCDFK